MHLINIHPDEIVETFLDSIKDPAEEINKSLDVYLGPIKNDIEKVLIQTITHIVKDYKNQDLQIMLINSLITSCISASINLSFTEFQNIQKTLHDKKNFKSN